MDRNDNNNKKSLILHFDINGTITAVDTTEPGSVEENANMVLSKSYYGKINEIGEWILNNESNYFQSDPPNISYYDYLKSKTKGYKRKSFTFTYDGEPGELLKESVSLVQSSMNTFLFKSFLKVLDMYPDALIVLRTFGLDIDETITEIIHHLPNKRFRKGSFTYDNNDDNNILLITDEGKYEGKYCGLDEINDILQLCCERHDNLALIEDYNHWNDSKRLVSFGKQIKDDERMVQIFFDDNDCVNIHTNNNNNNNNSHFVKVNTLHAMNNENYFIDFMKQIF